MTFCFTVLNQRVRISPALVFMKVFMRKITQLFIKALAGRNVFRLLFWNRLSLLQLEVK
jgi:hypothetical protein